MPTSARRRPVSGLVALSSALALLGSAVARAGASPVVIDNGTIALGVDAAACLNVDTTPPEPEGGPGGPIVGLRDLGTGLEGVSGGEPFEGWGIADLNSNWSGGATSLLDGIPPLNLTLVGFDFYDPERVVVTHEVSPPPLLIPEPTALLRITHDFHPSIVPRLYEIEVTVENLYYQPIAPRYRRLVDWDIQPSEFNEYVTIEYGPSTAVVSSSFNGFESPDPLDPLGGGGVAPTSRQPSRGRGTCLVNTEEVDCGPGDLGAALDFEFPQIPPGGKLRFWLYYGAAPTEAGALALLDEVGASAYTLGQSATNGTPMTFMLGFKAPWAIVDNGTVELGIDMFGALSVHGGTPPGGLFAPLPEGGAPPITGLRSVGSNYEGLALGPPREGWGVADPDAVIGSGTTSLVTTLFSGPERIDPEGIPPAPGVNMSPVDLDVFGSGTLAESVGRRAIVTTFIDDPPILKVIHDFRPSKSASLYEVVVVLENLTAGQLFPVYRRIADWNVISGEGDDLVTIQYPDASPVIHSVGTGFVSPDPLDAMFTKSCAVDAPFADCGPGDIGMGLDFDLDTLPAGGKEQFLLYYGSAPGEAAALTALAAVGADVYSIAEQPLVFSPEVVLPVFVFGFKDVLFVDDFETADSSRWSATVPVL